MSSLLFQPHLKSILVLGLGSRSLAKFCYQHLPDTKITVVEIDPQVLAFRNELKIPENNERFQVVLGDAALKMLSDIFSERILAVPVGRDNNHVVLAFNKPDSQPCLGYRCRKRNIKHAKPVAAIVVA